MSYDQQQADLMRQVAALEAEVARLKAGRFTADEIQAICHDLHGTVPVSAFAAGCADEQRRLYGCAPDADALREAHAYLSRLLVSHAPQCQPLPDLLGVCTQVDNLIAGLRRSQWRAPVDHQLKTLPEFFSAVATGRKTFEVRINDRDYRVGDTLLLLEWTESGGYTGRRVRREVTYVTDYAQVGGHVVLGLRDDEG